MLNIKKQVSKLYFSSILSNLSLTGAWVAILAARGFSLVQIGFAETVFHITSLIFEIPSGILADLFGRKNMLIVSNIMRMIANVIMIFSCNFFMVCASIAFHALSYNFSSGSGDALAYDSLKSVSKESYFEKYTSNQMMIYRIFSGISTMCAGFALFIGHELAYGTDLIVGIIQTAILFSLHEVRLDRPETSRSKNILRAIAHEFVKCFRESLVFLKSAKRALFLMFCNSLVGAVDILLLFFLQARLPEVGTPNWLLGPALFVMQLGGIIGAKLIVRFKKLDYRIIFTAASVLVLFGLFAERSGLYLIMTAGGFIAAVGDDALQVRTNALLQDMFPSAHRATLISIESFTFSTIMIVLSPLAGFLFSH